MPVEKERKMRSHKNCNKKILKSKAIFIESNNKKAMAMHK